MKRIQKYFVLPRAVYCVIGRCDWREDHTDILDKIDDYLWMKLSHVGDPQLLDGNQERLSLVELQKMLLEEYGNSKLHSVKNDNGMILTFFFFVLCYKIINGQLYAP